MWGKIGFLFLQFTLICNGYGMEIDSDQKFEALLFNVMKNYSNWLVENKLDPSNPMPDKVHFQNYPFKEPLLSCNVSNYFITGHSNITRVITKTKSNSNQRNFRVERIVQQPYQLIGDFDCFVALNVSHYMDLQYGVLLRGKGKFAITIKCSIESVKVYYFDDFPHYMLNWTDDRVFSEHDSVADNVRLTGSWHVGNEVITNGPYVAIIEKAFGQLYKTPFSRQHLPFSSHPSIMLLHGYLKQSLQGEILRQPNMLTTRSPLKVTQNISAKKVASPGFTFGIVILLVQFCTNTRLFLYKL